MNRALFSPRWILTTLLVLIVAGVMIRLGFWQLDRLEQRRAENARVQAQIDAPPLDLNQGVPQSGLEEMEYRQIVVRGIYDPDSEVLLRNQARDGLPGYHLLTPLHIDGSQQVILVDRGFIPMDSADTSARAQYRLPGMVEVRGIFMRAQNNRRFGVPDPTLAPGETRLDAWNAVNLNRIRLQVPGELLPVYLLAAPDPAHPGPPYAELEQPDLTEGPHMGYALQWFAFAAILGMGYPFFVRKQLRDGIPHHDARLS